MFQFEKPQQTPTSTAKLAVPQPVYDLARSQAEDAGVEVEAVLVQALETSFGFKRRRTRRAKADNDASTGPVAAQVGIN
jgi:hypothetical protein